ncbi:MAG: hypothetical protein Q9207_007528 [Kuettlingeria erythrocarpa]
MHDTMQRDPVAIHTDKDPGRNSEESRTSDITALQVVGVEEVNEGQRSPEISDSWSSEEQNRLSAMRAEGMTWHEIAKVMHVESVATTEEAIDLQNLSAEGTNILRAWLNDPQRGGTRFYPNEEQRQQLCRETGFTNKQINAWFQKAQGNNLPRVTTELGRGSKHEADLTSNNSDPVENDESDSKPWKETDNKDGDGELYEAEQREQYRAPELSDEDFEKIFENSTKEGKDIPERWNEPGSEQRVGKLYKATLRDQYLAAGYSDETFETLFKTAAKTGQPLAFLPSNGIGGSSNPRPYPDDSDDDGSNVRLDAGAEASASDPTLPSDADIQVPIKTSKVTESTTTDVETELLDYLKQFVNMEKKRVHDQRRQRVRNDKAIKHNDLRSFVKDFNSSLGPPASDRTRGMPDTIGYGTTLEDFDAEKGFSSRDPDLHVSHDRSSSRSTTHDAQSDDGLDKAAENGKSREIQGPHPP